jgi:hypothetical protein
MNDTAAIAIAEAVAGLDLTPPDSKCPVEVCRKCRKSPVWSLSTRGICLKCWRLRKRSESTPWPTDSLLTESR